MSSQRCVFHRLRQRFDQEDNQALDALLATGNNLAIAREMTAAGIRVSEHTVRRHRKGDCFCGTSVD